MNLFTPVTLGLLSLENRILMAPLTRMRASDDGVPGPLAAEYYAQRTSAGLIISEATQISPLGKGYPATPGIYSDAQVAAWRTVTDAVHARGGKIVLQLWHVGRISHSSLHPDEGLPVAPSAIQPAGKVYTASWSLAEYETPRALTLEEIGQLKADYVHAAEQAKAAGFDGVELHAANGYLLDQFLQDRTNQRTDAYGGSIANRCKLVLEILEAIIPVWGSGRVGIRLSPYGTFNDIADSDPKGLFAHLINALNPFNLSYLHLIEPRATTAGGNDQLVAGLIAGGLGLLLVVLYSLLYYRALGAVVIGSLLIAGLQVLVFCLLLGKWVGFTLTLAGIAGIIVAIGITADSFIVYFER
ncbi:MAG: alkene reductase, partial [Burkholderiaceae bacterium]|nr:alkene reductase [Burkholderiaceae bacterium]